MKNQYLSAEENKALQLIAEHRNYAFIREACGVDGLFRHSYDKMSRFFALIRRKTGLEKISADGAQKYLARINAAAENPSDLQRAALRLFVGFGENTHEPFAIGHALRLSSDYSEASKMGQALLSSALEEIGVFPTDPGEQRTQARIWVATHCTLSGMPAPSPTHLQIARLHAEGLSAHAIASETNNSPENVVALLRDACIRLGATSRGRGVQRRVLRAIFAWRDAQAAKNGAEITMDDPAF